MKNTMNDNYFNQYVSNFTKLPTLTDTEIAELHNKYILDQDIASLQKIVMHNMALVLTIAHGFTPNGSLTFKDMVQEGAMGLYRAACDFNPDINPCFSTFAGVWIRKAIRMALDGCHIVHHDKMYRMMQKGLKLSVTNSIHEKMEDGETEFAETIPSTDATPAEIAEENDQMTAMMNAVYDGTTLTEQERTIVVKHMGLDGTNNDKGMTLDEVSAYLGTNKTRERIRQIFQAALVKIKAKMNETKTEEQFAAIA